MKRSYSKSLVEIERFCQDIIDMQARHDIDSVLDYIFDFTDDLLLSGNTKQCNLLIEKLSSTIDLYTLDVIIGFLTITFPYKGSLSVRQKFYSDVKLYLNKHLNNDEVSELLRGLF